MKQFIYKKQFLNRFRRLPKNEQELLRKTNDQIIEYHKTHKASFGLRIKMLFRSKTGKVLEARAGENIRILWAEQKNKIVFLLIGTHDEVRNFIRSHI